MKRTNALKFAFIKTSIVLSFVTQTLASDAPPNPDLRDYTIALAHTTATVKKAITCPMQGGYVFFQNGKTISQNQLLPASPHCQLECGSQSKSSGHGKAVGQTLALGWVENLDAGDIIHIEDPLIVSLMCQTSSYESGENSSVDQVRIAFGTYLKF